MKNKRKFTKNRGKHIGRRSTPIRKKPIPKGVKPIKQAQVLPQHQTPCEPCVATCNFYPDGFMENNGYCFTQNGQEMGYIDPMCNCVNSSSITLPVGLNCNNYQCPNGWTCVDSNLSEPGGSNAMCINFDIFIWYIPYNNQGGGGDGWPSPQQGLGRVDFPYWGCVDGSGDPDVNGTDCEWACCAGRGMCHTVSQALCSNPDMFKNSTWTPGKYCDSSCNVDDMGDYGLCDCNNNPNCDTSFGAVYIDNASPPSQAQNRICCESSTCSNDADCAGMGLEGGYYPNCTNPELGICNNYGCGCCDTGCCGCDGVSPNEWWSCPGPTQPNSCSYPYGSGQCQTLTGICPGSAQWNSVCDCSCRSGGLLKTHRTNKFKTGGNVSITRGGNVSNARKFGKRQTCCLPSNECTSPVSEDLVDTQTLEFGEVCPGGCSGGEVCCYSSKCSKLPVNKLNKITPIPGPLEFHPRPVVTRKTKKYGIKKDIRGGSNRKRQGAIHNPSVVCKAKNSKFSCEKVGCNWNYSQNVCV